ncbi:MAG: dual specificity protein phosphatase family protein [Leptospiraceae bacterium]|nr:dual specificity protein phosphatase family protein [Leptospiraceae bacterium]
MKNIIIKSKSEIVELINKKYENRLFDAISIGDPDEDEPIKDYKKLSNYLRLEFFDMESGDPESNLYRIPEKEDFEKVISFYEKIKNSNNDLLIHCKAGISRSTAVGLFMIYKELISEKKSIDTLLYIRPKALPNRNIIKFIDEKFKTNFLEEINKIHDRRLGALEKSILEKLKNYKRNS